MVLAEISFLLLAACFRNTGFKLYKKNIFIEYGLNAVFLFIFIVTLIASFLMYRFIEKPLNKKVKQFYWSQALNLKVMN